MNLYIKNSEGEWSHAYNEEFEQAPLERIAIKLATEVKLNSEEEYSLDYLEIVEVDANKYFKHKYYLGENYISEEGYLYR